MKRSGPIKRKRPTPPTAEERRHIERVASLPCLVCGEWPVTVHHVTGYSNRAGRFARSHKLIVPLAARYHLIQHGPRESVEAVGHRGFYELHGIDLRGEAERLWEETLRDG